MQRSTSLHGFTLIELLVVVAIIVALIAILLPSMSKSVRVAEMAKCGSNMKQTITGSMLFAADNRGKYPPYDMNDWSRTVTNVGTANLEYDAQPIFLGWLAARGYIGDTSLGNAGSNVFYCPARDPWERYGYYGGASNPGLSNGLGWPSFTTNNTFWERFVESSYYYRLPKSIAQTGLDGNRMYMTEVFYTDTNVLNGVHTTGTFFGAPRAHQADLGYNVAGFDGAVLSSPSVFSVRSMVRSPLVLLTPLKRT